MSRSPDPLGRPLCSMPSSDGAWARRAEPGNPGSDPSWLRVWLSTRNLPRPEEMRVEVSGAEVRGTQIRWREGDPTLSDGLDSASKAGAVVHPLTSIKFPRKQTQPETWRSDSQES